MSFSGSQLKSISKTINSIKKSFHNPSNNSLSTNYNVPPHPPSTTIPTKFIQQTLDFPPTSIKPRNPYKKDRVSSPLIFPTTPSIQTHINNPYVTDFQWIGSKICQLDKDEVRVWIQNVNSLDISNNFNILMEQLDYLKQFQINILCLTEAQLNPLCSYVRDSTYAAVQSVYPGGHHIITNTPVDDVNNKQYGGLFNLVQGDLAQRLASKGSDPSGSFSWIDFYGKNQFLRIYTVYRVNPGNAERSGNDTAWRHQRNYLDSKNITTDPRHYVTQSLQQKIRADLKLNRTVMVCGDVNDDVFSQKGFSLAMTQVGLVNILEKHATSSEPLRTFSNGSRVIDGIWGTSNFCDYIVRCGMAPFQKVFQSDHRGLFIDVSLTPFLDSTALNLQPSPYRRLKFTVPSRVDKYCELSLEQWKFHNMSVKLKQLDEILDSLADKDSKSLILNKLDKSINDMMKYGEKNCCLVSRHCTNLFSFEMKKALRSNRQLGQLLSKTLIYMNHGLATSDDVAQLAKQKREAKRHLKHCQNNEQSLRDCFLDKLAIDIKKMFPNRKGSKSSIIKQLKHCETSASEASKIKFAINGPRSSGISYILVPGISSYSATVRAQEGFDYLNPNTIWERTAIANGKDISDWVRIDDIEIVTNLVTHFLVKHFGQSSSTPFANKKWVDKLSDQTIQQLLLDGSFPHDDTISEEANEILQSFQQPQNNISDISLLPTFGDFIAFIGKANEKTSASPSQRHYGHYKALMQGAQVILRGIFQVMTTALKHGIVLERWKKTVTTLLCKDDNTPFIHRLRPIHIVEVELQFFSKYLWSKRLMSVAEKHGMISDSQFGGRKNRQAQSSVINTITCFDIHRQLKKEFTFNDDDLRANYDRELSHFTAAETRKHGLPHEAGQLLIDITHNQQFHIKTQTGISKTFYTYDDQSPIWGLGQGISWAGSCWQFTATTIENCLKKTCIGATLRDPDRVYIIHPFLKFFIDDTTKICNQTLENRTLLQQARHNMQKHNNFVDATGGALALDKCRFFYIKYEFDKNHNATPMLTKDNPGELIIQTNNGPVTIKRLEPDEARKTLGCLISPTLNQLPQLNELKKMILDWKLRIIGSSLQNYLRIKAYNTVLKPRISYRLSTTSLSFSQCEQLMLLIRSLLINSHGIQRNFPKCIVEASATYAGLGIPHIYDLQGFEKLKFFKHHIHQMDETGRAIWISMRYTQLEIGISSLFYNSPFEDLHTFATPTWFTNLWEYLSKRELQLDLAKSIQFPNPRINDQYIMDILRHHFNTKDLIKLNKIRIALNLLFLSDVSNMQGNTLLPDIRKGKTYRTYHMDFPRQTFAHKWLSLWRKACDKLQKALSQKSLGSWTNRSFSCMARVSPCKLWLRYNQKSYFRQNISSSFLLSSNDFVFDGVESDIYFNKNKIIPIPSSYDSTATTLEKTTNAEQSYKLFGQFSRPLEIEQQICTSIRSNRAKMCCDGSVKDTYGSFAYGIAKAGFDECLMIQHAPVHGDLAQITSTRCELMGVLACVEYLHYLASKYTFDKKHFILISADNLAAIKAPNREYTSIKYTFLPDGDIIHTIQAKIQTLPFTVRFNHVKGHQDRFTAISRLSTLARLNINLDHHAKLFFTAPSNSPTYDINTPFSPHESVSIRDSYSRITNNFRANLCRMTVGYEAEVQIAHTLGIARSLLQDIDWDVLKKVRSSLSGYQQIQFTKLLHRQLPVMERSFTWKQSTSNICPLCKLKAETIEHIYQCQCLSVISTRKESIKSVKNILIELKTHPVLLRHLLCMLHQFSNEYPISQPTKQLQESSPDLYDALNSQFQLGVHNMVRGIISWKMAQFQQSHYTSIKVGKLKGTTWSKKLSLGLLTMSRTIWKRRCELVANAQLDTYEARIRHNCENLQHQLQTDPHLLPQSLQYLARKHSTFFHTKKTRVLQSWLTQVRNGIEKHKKRQPKDLRRWFKPVFQHPTSDSTTFDVPSDDYDSDDTANWIEKYPDEDPDLATWTDERAKIPHTEEHSSVFNFLHQSLTTTATYLPSFLQHKK